MSLKSWLNLNKRVRRLEGLIQKLEEENIALISHPFIEPSIDLPEGEFTRGRELEEDFIEADGDSVEEREYQEEQKWLTQRKQKAKMV